VWPRNGLLVHSPGYESLVRSLLPCKIRVRVQSNWRGATFFLVRQAATRTHVGLTSGWPPRHQTVQERSLLAHVVPQMQTWHERGSARHTALWYEQMPKEPMATVGSTKV